MTHDDVEMIVEQLRLLMDAVLTVAVCVRLSDPRLDTHEIGGN